MRSRIFVLSRNSCRASQQPRLSFNYFTSAETSQSRFVHTNIYNNVRSAVIVQCASMVMNSSVVEGSLDRGWDAGVAVDDDDGG
eukprot:scaffold41892_cov79-Cyclotella_meneghiniana.AAC.2